MMEYTDRHFRYFMRLLTRRAVLYTEMVTANALVRTDNPLKFLEADMVFEDPLVLQLGGSDSTQIEKAAKLAADAKYSEININVGCPSEKVAGAGCFGAALMLRPDIVSDLSLRIADVTGKPATVKCRIGVDDVDSYDDLHKFITSVHTIGKVNHFIIHARKAVLGAKFSPEYNRKVPPLKYDFVYRLVKDFPHIAFSLNGGVCTYAEVKEHLLHGVVGVMVGRSIINTPYYWRNIDSELYGVPDPGLSRRDILAQYSSYAYGIETSQGPKSRRALMKPVINLFAGDYGGRLFRNRLDEYIRSDILSIQDVLEKAAMECIPEYILDSTCPYYDSPVDPQAVESQGSQRQFSSIMAP